MLRHLKRGPTFQVPGMTPDLARRTIVRITETVRSICKSSFRRPASDTCSSRTGEAQRSGTGRGIIALPAPLAGRRLRMPRTRRRAPSCPCGTPERDIARRIYSVGDKVQYREQRVGGGQGQWQCASFSITDYTVCLEASEWVSWPECR